MEKDKNTEIIFDASSLNKADYEFYISLTPKQKEAYKKKWIAVEKQKQKLKQEQAKISKMKAVQRTKRNKERNHYMIEIGSRVLKVIGTDETHKMDLDAWESYLKTYAGAIKKQVIPKKAPETSQKPQNAPEAPKANEVHITVSNPSDSSKTWI